MKPGKHYRVQKMANNATSVKLVCMGVIPGKIVQLVRRAPFGGAYYLSCDDKRMGISATELKHLDLVEVDLEEKLMD